jgi:hypothetical protein
MQKIPTPIVISLIVAAVLLLSYVVFKNVSASSSDTGNIQAINAEILKNNPKDAPELPPDTSHVDVGVRKKHSN